MKHNVKISIADKNGVKKEVLSERKVRLPKKILSWLFGDFSEILVLKPGQTVETVEIQEIKGGNQ